VQEDDKKFYRTVAIVSPGSVKISLDYFRAQCRTKASFRFLCLYFVI